MVQSVTAFANKPGDPSEIPRTPKLSSDLRMCAVIHVHPPLCTTQISKGVT